MVELLYDCFRVMSEVYSRGAYLADALSSVPIDPKNRAAVTKICYGTAERDFELECSLSILAPRPPKAAVRTLLKICFYLLKYLEKPPYAVTDAAVELLKKMGKGGVGGFANAVIRAYGRGAPLPEDPFLGRCAELSAPPFAVRRLDAEYGEELSSAILAPAAGRTYVRFASDGGEEYLKERGIAAIATPFPRLFEAPSFRRDEGYDRGVYTFQSIGSVAVADAIEGGGSLLDCCAAPGGKSVLLSEKFDRVLARDLHPHRVELIRAYARRMGRTNVTAEAFDSSRPSDGETFDAVLVDAPCSGYGVLADRPDIRIFRKEESLAELTRAQKALLDAAAERVAVGGKLYYSTCSVFPEENRMQADAFLASHPNFAALPVASPLPSVPSGVGIQFLPPLSLGAGFYLAKFGRRE